MFSISPRILNKNLLPIFNKNLFQFKINLFVNVTFFPNLSLESLK